MNPADKKLSEEVLMQKLKDILLREDRAELERLRQILEHPDQLSAKVTPIIEEHIEFLKQNFPAEFHQVVDDIFEKKLAASQEAILNVIYPTMGKMISKYIAHQFQELKEKIDHQVTNTFSIQAIKDRFKASFSGVKKSDIILSNMDNLVIDEIYLIQRHSGLLLASASREKKMNQDVIAGMLTAIKAFVEDAFEKEAQELDLIQYDSYKIFIQNFHGYYIAVALSGAMSASDKRKLSNSLLDFAEGQLKGYKLATVNKAEYDSISQKLTTNFIGV
ncbi:MAG: hypothetical protein AB8G15_20845 [Saprospiraceae bacterium]